MENQIHSSITETNKFNFKDYLSFKQMITLKFIPIVYIVVAVIITLMGLVMMFSGGGRSSYGYGEMSPMAFMPGGFFGGLLYIIFGNLFWRLWCEFIIVLFRINKGIDNVEKNTRKD